MAVRMVKAGSYDSIFGSDYHSDSSTGMYIYILYIPQRFTESLQSGHAEILSVFPQPIWNFELNIFITPFVAFRRFYYFERG